MNNIKDLKRKELEDKIRIYKKNNKVLCDILVFYRNMSQYDNWTFSMIAELIIKELEDPEIYIDLKAKKITDILKEDFFNYRIILKQLATSSYDDLFENFHQDYRINKLDSLYISSLETLDFIEELSKKSATWTKEILISNIDINKRVEFLKQVILNYINSDFPIHSLSILLNCNPISTSKKESKEKLEKLLFIFKNEKNSYEILNEILKQKNSKKNNKILKWIKFLQEKEILDFTTLKFEVGTQNLETSICAYLCKKEISSFDYFYELPEYKNISKCLKYNDDYVILNTIDEYEIPNFISLSNFEITVEKIELIGNIIMKVQRNLNTPLKNLIENIESSIIHKAKNKEEYKEMNKYVSLFHELSDYEKLLKIEHQERIKLENKRLLVTLLLHNMNESLQEQVPNDKQIKSLKFKKN